MSLNIHAQLRHLRSYLTSNNIDRDDGVEVEYFDVIYKEEEDETSKAGDNKDNMDQKLTRTYKPTRKSSDHQAPLQQTAIEERIKTKDTDESAITDRSSKTKGVEKAAAPSKVEHPPTATTKERNERCTASRNNKNDGRPTFRSITTHSIDNNRYVRKDKETPVLPSADMLIAASTENISDNTAALFSSNNATSRTSSTPLDSADSRSVTENTALSITENLTESHSEKSEATATDSMATSITNTVQHSAFSALSYSTPTTTGMTFPSSISASVTLSTSPILTTSISKVTPYMNMVSSSSEHPTTSTLSPTTGSDDLPNTTSNMNSSGASVTASSTATDTANPDPSSLTISSTSSSTPTPSTTAITPTDSYSSTSVNSSSEAVKDINLATTSDSRTVTAPPNSKSVTATTTTPNPNTTDDSTKEIDIIIPGPTTKSAPTQTSLAATSTSNSSGITTTIEGDATIVRSFSSPRSTSTTKNNSIRNNKSTSTKSYTKSVTTRSSRSSRSTTSRTTRNTKTKTTRHKITSSSTRKTHKKPTHKKTTTHKRKGKGGSENGGFKHTSKHKKTKPSPTPMLAPTGTEIIMITTTIEVATKTEVIVNGKTVTVTTVIPTLGVVPSYPAGNLSINDGASHASSATIAGAVMGASAGVAALVGGSYILRKRYQKGLLRRRQQTELDNADFYGDPYQPDIEWNNQFLPENNIPHQPIVDEEKEESSTSFDSNSFGNMNLSEKGGDPLDGPTRNGYPWPQLDSFADDYDEYGHPQRRSFWSNLSKKFSKTFRR